MPILYVCLVVHLENRAVGEFFLVRSQRADEVAEAFGQHRYGAVNEIHAGGTLHRLFVYHRTFSDIVRHVGNVHTHFPQPLVGAAYGESVVEVLGVVGVNGTGEHAAEILAFCNVLLRYLGRNFLGSLLHVLRIFVWQSVLCQYGVHLGVVVALLSQHVNHLAHDVLVFGVGPLLHLHHHFVAVLSALEPLFRQYYVVWQQSVLCSEEGDVPLHSQPSHKLVACPVQDSNHHSFLYVSCPSCHEGHLHLVAVEGAHRVAFRHENGLATVVGNKTVLSVQLAAESSFLHLCLCVQAI